MNDLCELGAPPPVDPVEARAAQARLLTRLLPGRQGGAVRIGRYRVLDKLGKGAHGVVYGAYDPQLDRRVAIKLLERPEHAGTQILREARMLAKLSHPNIVTVYEVGEHEGDVFVTMEFVQGSTLGRWLAEAKRSPVEILEVFTHAAEGLAHAHEHGVVHRDFKPANVMIDAQGRVRVMDFGLARVVERAFETSHDDPSRESFATWSSGTPAYMAPEQHRAELVDGRSDQYSLCLAAWEALLGAHPFESALGSVAQVMALHEAKLDGPPSLPASATAGLRKRQVDALRRGLSPDPADRWPQMRALARALRPRPLPVGRLTAAAFVLGISASAGVLLAEDEACDAAGESLERSWNEGTRDSLVDSLRGAAGPMGATATRVSARIDDYAQRWIGTARSICLAELPASLERARTGCLEVEQARFDATLEVLGEGDPAVVQRAHELVLGLPDPRRCEQTDAALSYADGGEVLELRRRMARASARTKAGRYTDAARMFSELEAEVEGSADPAVIAEFAVERADIFRALGEAEAAHESGLRAISFAAESERWDLLAGAATVLSYVLGEQLGRPGEGLEYARIAVRISDGHGVDVDQALIARLHHAGALHQSGDSEGAMQAYADTAERARAVGRPLTEAAALADRATLASQGGQLESAVEAMTRSLEISWEVRGFDHPEDAVTRFNLGTILMWLGREEEARPHLQRARQAFVDAYGELHEDVGRVDQALGNLHSNRGEHEEALRRYRVAYGVREGAEGPRARLASETAVAMASTLVRLGRHAEAWPLFEEGISTGAESPGHLANAHRWYAQALADVGRDEAAEAQLREAVKIQRNHQPQARQMTMYIRALGRHLVRREKYEEAETVLAQIWPAIRDDAGFNPSVRGEVAWLFAQIRSHQGKACEARALATEALEGFEADPNASGAERVRDWVDAHPKPPGCG